MSKVPKRVLVAGHICLDITPTFPNKGEKINLSDIFVGGNLVNVDKAEVSLGGAVANTGLALQLFGVSARLVARVGDDAFSQLVMQLIDLHQVEHFLKRDKDAQTSYSVVLAVPGNDRIFLHNPGANDWFCANDVTDAMMENMCHMHFGYPPLMLRMFYHDGEELVQLFKRAKEKGLTTSLDMAAIDSNTSAGEADWPKILSRVLPYTDIFMPSVGEVGYMLDQVLFEDWRVRANGDDISNIVHIEAEVEPLASKLLALGAKVIVVKCGAKGIYYCSKDKKGLESLCEKHQLSIADWSDVTGFESSFKPDAIYSSTGAGDTSIAAFLAAMIEGNTLKKCVELATGIGAMCLTAFDAIGGLIPLADVSKRISEGWEKQNN